MGTTILYPAGGGRDALYTEDLKGISTIQLFTQQACAGSRYARWNVQVALAPSVTAQLMISQRSYERLATILRASRALVFRTRDSPTITGRRIDVLELGGLRPPARTFLWTQSDASRGHRALATLSLARSGCVY